MTSHFAEIKSGHSTYIICWIIPLFNFRHRYRVRSITLIRFEIISRNLVQITQRAFQRWINVESTSDLNVETTVKYGWTWKLDGRWNDDVESTSITWRWFNIGASTLNQRWLSDVESTSYYLYPTFNPNHNTTFICNTDAVENEI